MIRALQLRVSDQIPALQTSPQTRGCCGPCRTSLLRVCVAVMLKLTELAQPVQMPCLCCNTGSARLSGSDAPSAEHSLTPNTFDQKHATLLAGPRELSDSQNPEHSESPSGNAALSAESFRQRKPR